MIGSFLTRGLMMVFGYAYPAYECYKTVEKNKPEIEKLRFWCQYWILVAVLTVCERIGDAFISWVPMYSEAKLAFFIYLWYPKTMGTTYVYDSFFRPYVAKHENEIDRNLLELRTRAGDMAVLYWQRAASYGQTRVFDILQYVAAQSTPRQRPAQAQQGARARQAPSTPKRQLSAGSNNQPATTQPETEEPLSPLSSLSSSQKGARARQAPSTPKRQLSAGSNHQPATTPPETEEPLSPLSSLCSSQNPLEVSEEVDPSRVPEPDLPPVALNAPKAAATSKTSSQVTKNEAEAMQIEALPSSSANENANPQPKEMVMEETGPVTRAKSKRTRPGGGQKNA